MSGGFQTGFEKGGPKLNTGGGGGFATGFGGDQIKANKPPKPKGGGGGFFGSIGHALGSTGHFIEKKASLAGHDLAGMPGGIYHAGVNINNAGADLVSGHPRRAFHDIAPMEKGFVKGTYETIRHPLRDPFQTASLVAPGLDVAGRVGEAGLAAREAAAADESSALAAGRALVRRHGANVAPRALRMGDKEINLIPSRNAGARLIQRGYDRLTQNAMDKQQGGDQLNRMTEKVAAHGVKRVKGAIAEEERAAQRMRAVPADMLDRAASRLNLGKLPRAAREHQAALELTSTQTMPEEAARFHEEQAAAGVNPHQNAAVAKLYRRVQQRNLVKFDESRPVGEQVHINPAEKHLAQVDERLAGVGNRGDQILIDHGQMTPEGTRAAINAPGRVRAGAQYVNPTPGRLGVPSHVLKEAEAQVAKLEKLHAKAALKAMGNPSARSVVAHTTGIEMPWEESPVVSRLSGALSVARDRLQKLEEQAYNRQEPTGLIGGEGLPTEEHLAANPSERHIPVLYHKNGVTVGEPGGSHADFPTNKKGVQGYAVVENGKVARTNFTAPHGTSLTDLGRFIDQYDRNPEVQDSVKNAIESRFGRAARPGRTHISYRTSEKTAQQGPAVRFTNKVTGKAASPISSHEFTGESVRQGLIPNDVTGMKSRAFRQIVRNENTVAQRDTIWQTGSDVSKGTGHEVLLGNPEQGVNLGKISSEVRQAIGQEKPTFDKAHELTKQEQDAAEAEGLRAALEARVGRWLDQSHQRAGRAAGIRAPDNYRWVDERLLGGLQDQIAPKAASRASEAGAKIGRGFDNVNSAITSATVYFKVGHTFTRGLTNAVTNIMQGSLNPLELAKTVKFDRDAKAALGSDFKEFENRLLAASGQMGYSSLPHEGTEGLFGRSVSTAARKGSGFWAHRFDAPFRRNALLYELRKAGYKTPEDVSNALDAIQSGGKGLAAHQWSKLSAAFRRADREAISYDRLNGFERNFLSRAIWFYPWVKGSTMFTLRSMVEHPYKMSVAANLGVQGRKEQAKGLGAVPSYEQGLIDIGHGKTPETVDMSTFSPFATAGQLANIPSVPGSISQQFNPALGALTQYATGTNQYGEPSNTPLSGALSSLLASTPESQIAGAMKRGGKGSSKKMFPGMNTKAEIERYLLGPGLARRRVNKAALAKAAAREHDKRFTVYSSK